jgi:hypothetical protein
MDLGDRVAIRLCGPLHVTLEGEDIAARLPGWQGRLLLVDGGTARGLAEETAVRLAAMGALTIAARVRGARLPTT